MTLKVYNLAELDYFTAMLMTEWSEKEDPVSQAIKEAGTTCPADHSSNSPSPSANLCAKEALKGIGLNLDDLPQTKAYLKCETRLLWTSLAASSTDEPDRSTRGSEKSCPKRA